LISLFCAVSTVSVGQTDFQPNPAAGPGSIIVHSKFGGQIFGFDIDQNGTEGVLSEAQDLTNGNILAAVETFDQATGKILSVVTRTQTQDDFVTLGVVGRSVGLIEHEHVVSFLNVQRTFGVINPLTANKFTGRWTPPIGTKHLINQVSRTQGASNAAVFAEDNSGNFTPYAFSSNVAANTFGPVIHIQDSFNFGSVPPPMAYNTVTNQAILGGGDGCFGCLPVIGLASLGKGTFTEFTGIGFGFVNGIAVDSTDNCLHHDRRRRQRGILRSEHADRLLRCPAEFRRTAVLQWSGCRVRQHPQTVPGGAAQFQFVHGQFDLCLRHQW